MSNPPTDLADLVYERIYDAPAALVFECMTTPEHLTHFWGPVGVSTPIENITVDLRVGGAFVTIMVNDADGEEYASRGVYTEIDPPHLLTFAESLDSGAMTTSITFTDLGDGRCQTVTTQRNVPEMFRSPESQAGMQSSFTRLDDYLARLQS